MLMNVMESPVTKKRHAQTLMALSFALASVVIVETEKIVQVTNGGIEKVGGKWRI